jgi:hypothetical protein
MVHNYLKVRGKIAVYRALGIVGQARNCFLGYIACYFVIEIRAISNDSPPPPFR